MIINKREHIKSNKEKILLFLTAAFGLSSLTNLILGSIGFPFYLLEVFFIPLFIFYEKNIFIKKNKVNIFCLFTMLITFTSILIGIGYTYDIGAIITCVRPLLYMIILIYYFPKIAGLEIQISKLFIVSLGIISGELVYILLNYSNVQNSGYTHINIIAIAYCVLIPFIVLETKYIVIGTIFPLMVSILSGYRINIFVSIIALFIGGLYYLKNASRGRRLVYIILSLSIIYCLYIFFDDVVQVLIETFQLSDATVFRLIEKTKGVFTQEWSQSDLYRINLYVKELPTIMLNVLPVGPIGKAIGAEKFGLYTDFPISYLIDVYGSILAIFIIVIMFGKGLNLFLRVFKSELPDICILSGLMFPIIVVLFIINGTFLTFAHIAILAAIVMGYWRIKV